MSTPLALPQITLSGSTGASLRDDFLAARRALEHAKDEVKKTIPHPRDYQVNEAEYVKAVAQHWSRIEAIDAKCQELMTLAEHCDKYAKD